MRLLLFDIDGTLLTCGGQPRPLFAAALQDVFGRTGDIDGYDFAGKTDPRIVIDLMRGAGVGDEEIERGLPRVRDAYLDRLEAHLDPGGVRVYPGVVELLNALGEVASGGGCEVALLTGNWERGARIKLTSVGLDRHFAFGSFGDESPDRRLLPPRALARARERTGRTFAAEECWVIGDSLLDVDCARAHGLPCLGVATSRTSAAALAAAGAAAVVDDLARTADVLRILLGAVPAAAADAAREAAQ
jgi:phosphoglycolate phosphatase-like HAD superfamily hydrolase